MGRSPCCDQKMGLKKGPWTPQEDHILINFITLHGHPNWRALPKQAGLLRCGKSCRLRWTNYLRPDIKRGNFTHQEEQTIINLHQQLGNRWSIIAARLSGRTDNEIKNVWHTDLKKRLLQISNPSTPKKRDRKSKKEDLNSMQQDKGKNINEHTSSSEISNCSYNVVVEHLQEEQGDYFLNLQLHQTHNDFWMDIEEGDFPYLNSCSPADLQSQLNRDDHGQNDMGNFWYSLFIRSNELSQVL